MSIITIQVCDWCGARTPENGDALRGPCHNRVNTVTLAEGGAGHWHREELLCRACLDAVVAAATGVMDERKKLNLAAATYGFGPTNAPGTTTP